MAGNNANNTNNSDRLFKLEVITPQKSVFSGDVEILTAPGVSGSFQVLRSHAPLLATIGIGELRIMDQTGNELVYSTSGGFVEVNHNVASFLADAIEPKSQIDVGRARAARERAEERLNKKEPGTDIARARAALARAINRLRIAGK